MTDDLVTQNLNLYTQLTSWRDTVIEALVVAHIYKDEHWNNPKKAVDDLLNWEAGVAEYFAHKKYKNAQMELDL